jgi:hypothetical protein
MPPKLAVIEPTTTATEINTARRIKWLVFSTMISTSPAAATRVLDH